MDGVQSSGCIPTVSAVGRSVCRVLLQRLRKESLKSSHPLVVRNLFFLTLSRGSVGASLSFLLLLFFLWGGACIIAQVRLPWLFDSVEKGVRVDKEDFLIKAAGADSSAVQSIDGHVAASQEW